MRVIYYFEHMTNPFNTMSSRAIRIIYTAAAVITLAICTLHILKVMVFNVTSNDECAWVAPDAGKSGLLIKGVVPGGVSDQAGIKDGDLLLKINGQEVNNNGAQRILNAVKLNEYATYLIDRNGTQFETHVRVLKIFDILSLSLFLLGFGFLIVGYVVVMTKPQGEIQRMFGTYGILSMLLFALLRPSIDRVVDPLWQIILIITGLSVGRFFAPTVFIKFFLYFPVKQNIPKRKLILISLFILNFIGTLCLILFGNKIPTTPAIALAFLPILYFIIGLCIFAVSYFKQLDVARRNPLKPILYSVAIGIATFVYIGILITVNPFAIFLNPILVVPVILTIAVPLAFGYAIFRYRLMDIDLIVKRSLVYGTVTAAIAAIYLGMVYGVGNIVAYIMGTEDNRAVNLFALILIALVFDPLKRRTQASIDHMFYQERLNYQKALLEFSQELPSQINLEQILSSMVNRISTTMHVEKVAVVLCDEREGCYSKSINIDDRSCIFTSEENGLLALLKETHSAQSFILLEEEPDSIKINATDKEKIVSSGIVLSVPIILQNRIIGMINVGPKLSGKVYSQEDIDLLSTVASQAAIAIENARLHISEVEKQKIEGELKLAWKIQQGLLPKGNPSIEGLDITGITLPARTVGGDYFDYIQLGPKKILVIVADVSGKGMSAALYMSKVQGMVQLAAQMYSSPRDILIHVNRRLYDGMERNSFITMIVALFDLDKRELRICRAGHNKAIIGMNGDLSYLQAKGIGLGLERGTIFERELEEVVKPLHPNELLMFYTDGLTEAMDEQKNQFGEEAVCNLLKDHTRLSAADLQQALISAVKTFQGTAEQHDDVTLVVVKTL